jgi:hypothetical protein
MHHLIVVKGTNLQGSIQTGTHRAGKTNHSAADVSWWRWYCLHDLVVVKGANLWGSI